MIRSIWILSIYVRALMQRCMPTNILLALIRRRQGLKWGVPAMFVAVPYLMVANWCSTLVGQGGPGWLNLIILICLWNAMKFVVMGPVSVVLLLRARHHEAAARRAVESRELTEERAVALSR
ncbi:sulfate permease [Microbacterium sp. A204]|uniref:sulfate permease n=1 Tax=Microbacterium sp. A204 TaxID=3457321 RepID=UPI003FD6AD16